MTAFIVECNVSDSIATTALRNLTETEIGLVAGGNEIQGSCITVTASGGGCDKDDYTGTDLC